MGCSSVCQEVYKRIIEPITIHSTPWVCVHGIGDGYSFCENTNATNDYQIGAKGICLSGNVGGVWGTRYKNAVGSSGGGLKIERIAEDDNWFHLFGYSKPIYCEDDVCGQITTGNFQHLPSNTEFELVLINGEREIQLVSSPL